MNADLPKPSLPVWEDLVDDLLEISCAVTEESRLFLCDLLRKQKISAESIRSHTSFSIAELVVVIKDGSNVQECWFFDPKQKKVRRLTESNGRIRKTEQNVPAGTL